MSSFNVFDIASQGMSAQNIRLNTVASNMANAESIAGSEKKAYRAKQPIFQPVQIGADDSFETNVPSNGVKVSHIDESTRPLTKQFSPNHPQADENGYIYPSNVNIIEEMADMISASRTYQTNVEMINTAKELMMQTINLGK